MERSIVSRAEFLAALPGLQPCDILNLSGDMGDVVLTADNGINYVTLRGGTFADLTITGSGWRVQGAVITGAVIATGREIIITGDPETGVGDMQGGAFSDAFLHGMRVRGTVTFTRGRAISNVFDRMPGMVRGPVAQRTMLKNNTLNGVPIPNEG